MGYVGVGWVMLWWGRLGCVMQGWGVSCRGGVGWVFSGVGMCGVGVCHAGVGWVM